MRSDGEEGGGSRIFNHQNGGAMSIMFEYHLKICG
jgi:hypothetical protein